MNESIFSELDAWLEDAAGIRPPEPKWVPVCVCGHLVSCHPADQGGDYAMAGTLVQGCVGPMRGRNQWGEVLDPTEKTYLRYATCPCRAWRPVIEIDRPRHILFRSKMGPKHPLKVALGGFRTQIQRATGLEDEALAEAVSKRFRWLPGARRCAVCGAEDGTVWPMYVDEERDSEMRCEEHR